MEGQIVRTIKDFLTTKDGELCVNQDEYLQVRNWNSIYSNSAIKEYIKYSFDLPISFLLATQVIEKVDRHWVKCRMESREGLIPSSHITQVENIPKISQNQCIFKSTRDHPAQGNGQISFKKGKYVIKLKNIDQ